jgi:hypothetical protein
MKPFPIRTAHSPSVVTGQVGVPRGEVGIDRPGTSLRTLKPGKAAASGVETISKNSKLHPPRIELGTFRVLGECHNQLDHGCSAASRLLLFVGEQATNIFYNVENFHHFHHVVVPAHIAARRVGATGCRELEGVGMHDGGMQPAVGATEVTGGIPGNTLPTHAGQLGTGEGKVSSQQHESNQQAANGKASNTRASGARREAASVWSSLGLAMLSLGLL